MLPVTATNLWGSPLPPDGRHPFGTENCCIFFKDDTFLEPLGIAQRETCEAKAIRGNTFVANDQNYRFRRGNEGFSHLVIKSDDARADHAAFKAAGMSGGKMVRFSRAYKGQCRQQTKSVVSSRLCRRSPQVRTAGFLRARCCSPRRVGAVRLSSMKTVVSGHQGSCVVRGQSNGFPVLLSNVP